MGLPTTAYRDSLPSKAYMSCTVFGAILFIAAGTAASRFLHPDVMILPDVPIHFLELAGSYAGNGAAVGSLRQSCVVWSGLFAANGTYFAPPDYLPAVGANATARVCEQLYSGRQRPRRPVIEHIRPVAEEWESNGRTELKIEFLLRGFSVSGHYVVPCTSILHLDRQRKITKAWDFLNVLDLPPGSPSDDAGSHPPPPPPRAPPRRPRIVEELFGLFGGGP